MAKKAKNGSWWKRLLRIRFLAISVIVLGTLATLIQIKQVQTLQQHAQVPYYNMGIGVVSPGSNTSTIMQPRISVPPGCYPIACTIACPLDNPNCCPVRYVCPSGVPQPTCIPRPACLDANPPCGVAEPQEGWCPPTPPVSVTPSPTPPPGCFYKPGICPMIACRFGNCPPCKPMLICPSLTPSPEITCIPRPPCLDSVPRCYIAEPQEGWCPPTPPVSVTPSLTPPPGCFYQHICMMNPHVPCAINGSNCESCHDILTCASGTISPQPTCIPRPSCLDDHPACQIPEPIGGWCPPSPIFGGNPVISFIHAILQGLFHF